MAVWEVERPSPTEILGALEGASTRDEAIVALASLGLSQAQAQDAIDIVAAARSRSLLLSAGMRRDQFQGDLEDDPLFLTALHHSSSLIIPSGVLPLFARWRGPTFAILGICILLTVAVVVLLRLLTGG